MNNALQAYNVMTSPTSDVTPQRSINSVHIHLFYHIAQAKQAQHGSLVDRGANGGLAGSDVRVLSKSDRIPSTTPGAEPPRDAKDSGSARPHSMHLETSSSNRP